LHKFFIELLGYGWVSIVALAVDVVILKTLVTEVGWHYFPASSVAFISGAGVAYLFSVRFVFRFRQLQSRTLEFGYFMALGGVGFIVNAITLSLAISAAGLGLVSAKLLAAGCTFATNFTLRRLLLFSP